MPTSALRSLTDTLMRVLIACALFYAASQRYLLFNSLNTVRLTVRVGISPKSKTRPESYTYLGQVLTQYS